MRRVLLSVVVTPLLMGSFSALSASEGVTILDDLELSGEFRPRYERVDVKDNGKDTANALTTKTTLTLKASLLGVEGLSTNVGVTSVNNFGYDNYNSTSNGKTEYDVIVDPQQAMMSDANIEYKMGKTLFHAGRSAINLDNQRFIGTVGWRQMPRAYDTLYVSDSSINNLNLLAAYVYGFQGVKEQSEAIDTKSAILHATYKVSDMLNITAYDYMLGSISDTLGVALNGGITAGAKISYRLEYAKQKDATLEYKVEDVKADASYFMADLGANYNGFIAGVNYECLSGSNGDDGKTAFNPVLGTNHKFNGWADMFYVANKPLGGLRDMNVRLGYANKSFGKLLAFYHDFKADEKMASANGMSDDLGSEFDILYSNPIPAVKNLTGLVKFAAYSKGDVTGYTNDVQKLWLMLDYKFSIK